MVVGCWWFFFFVSSPDAAAAAKNRKKMEMFAVAAMYSMYYLDFPSYKIYARVLR
jgi:hypothetical protein